MILFDLIYWIFIIGIVIVPISIFYLIAKHNRKTKAIKIAMIIVSSLYLFVIIFWVLEVFPGSKSYFASKKASEILGQEVSVESIYYFDEIAGFQGDGYTLEYWKLAYPEKTMNERLLLNYSPNLYGDEWTSSQWKKTPISSDDIHLFEGSILNLYGENEGSELNKVNNYLKEAVYSSDNYYAFSTRDGGIEMYFLSIKDNKIIRTNSAW